MSGSNRKRRKHHNNKGDNTQLGVNQEAGSKEKQHKDRERLEAENPAQDRGSRAAESPAQDRESREPESPAQDRESREPESPAQDRERLEAESPAQDRERLEAENPAQDRERLEAENPAQDRESREPESPAQDQKEHQEEKRVKTETEGEQIGPQEQEDRQEDRKTKKKKGTRIIGLLAVFFIVGLIGVGVWYGRGVVKYKSCFVQGTVINGIDCSEKQPEEICRILDQQIQSYTLEVYGRNPKNPAESIVIGRITPEDIQLHKKDTAELVGNLFGQQNPYTWFQMYWKTPAPASFTQELVFDQGMLDCLVGSWDACGDKALAPQDAYISEYMPQEKGYTIIPETEGSQMTNYRSILSSLETAIYAGEARVDVEELDCYKAPKVTAKDQKLMERLEEMNRPFKAKISYDWYGEEFVVDVTTYLPWISMEDGEITLNEEAVTAFIREKSNQLDPRGHKYPFQTALGAEVTLEVKSGWRTDVEKEVQELITLIKEGAVTDRTPASSTSNYVQFTGETGVGDSYVEADLTNQHYYLFYKGEMILETDFVSGDIQSGHRTPEGIFALTYKTKNRVLRGPGYASFVYYWMPYYGNYGMHDATWRSVFGGQIYLTNGSHGCLNLPLEKAKVVYGYVETGFPVVCYYYPEGQNPKKQIPEDETEDLVEENEIHGQW